MKTSRRLFVALTLAAAVALPAWSLENGAAAPELKLPGLKDTVDLASMKGKVVYLDFWASWCVPCKQSFPFMNDLQSRYQAQGLQIVAVNLDAKRDDAERFLTEMPAQFTIAIDTQGQSARRFQIKGMPSSVLVGRDGRVISSHKGFRAEDRQQIEQSIVAALAAK